MAVSVHDLSTNPCSDKLAASYNASKAALQHWSNTLRVEMAPFRYVDATTNSAANFHPFKSQSNYGMRLLSPSATLLLADTDVSLGDFGRSKHEYPKSRRPEKTSRRLVHGVYLIYERSLILYSQGSYYSALAKEFEQHVLRKPSKMNITIISVFAYS